MTRRVASTPDPAPASTTGATPPPCTQCNGYGSADGLPCGTDERDFYNDPGPCTRCDGTGDEPNRER